MKLLRNIKLCTKCNHNLVYKQGYCTRCYNKSTELERQRILLYTASNALSK